MLYCLCQPHSMVQKALYHVATGRAVLALQLRAARVGAGRPPLARRHRVGQPAPGGGGGGLAAWPGLVGRRTA